MLATDAKAPPPVADADDLFMRLSVPELNAYERRTRYTNIEAPFSLLGRSEATPLHLPEPTAHLAFYVVLACL